MHAHLLLRHPLKVPIDLRLPTLDWAAVRAEHHHALLLFLLLIWMPVL